jgi:arylsulfatase A
VPNGSRTWYSSLPTISATGTWVATAHPRFKGTSACGGYGDFIHELDWIVGQIAKALDEQGLADDTLVVFTSDNGGMFNVGGQAAWKAGHEFNGELLGFKFDAWEGGHRVPFIARWPRRIRAGTVSGQLICNVDLLATFAAIAGSPVRKGEAVDSVNVLPALLGAHGNKIRDHVLLAARQPAHLSVRKGKWMYIGAKGGGGFTAAKRGAHAFGGPAAITYCGRENSDIESGKLKPGAPPGQLYDLDADLAQTTNLYRQYPEIVMEMKALLARYRRAVPKKSRRKTNPRGG